jgi:hypothetical protein
LRPFLGFSFFHPFGIRHFNEPLILVLKEHVLLPGRTVPVLADNKFGFPAERRVLPVSCTALLIASLPFAMPDSCRRDAARLPGLALGS